MSVESMPRTIHGPTSAYEVLQRVQSLIREDHRRLHMGQWIREVRSFRDDYPWGRTKPECGTVACLSGWIGHVTGFPNNGAVPTQTSSIIAEWGSDAQRELYANFTDGDHFFTDDGTLYQAGKALLFLDDYMSKYEAQLKARIILPGGTIQE